MDLFNFRSELQVWVFSKWGARLCHSCPVSDGEREKMYDAYVSYSIKDEHFVTQVLSFLAQSKNLVTDLMAS